MVIHSFIHPCLTKHVAVGADCMRWHAACDDVSKVVTNRVVGAILSVRVHECDPFGDERIRRDAS
jgi:hypothetical protein